MFKSSYLLNSEGPEKKTDKETCGGKRTSSSLPRVVEAMAEVIPALREFCTRD